MIGVYALWFDEPSMIYIGASKSIKLRYSEHIYLLKNNKHTNYKVQNCFNKFGVPELVVLEKCSENELNYLERLWQIEFNSIEDGLDLVVAGQVGYGYSSNSSKYSKLIILKIFSLLSGTNMTQLEISNKVKVPKSLVSDIKTCKTHHWLKDEYPARYNKMKTRQVNKFIGTEIKIKNIKSGEVVKVSNLEEFARNRELPEAASSGLGRLRSGTRKRYRDWILEE